MSIIPPHDPLCPMAVGPAFANSGPLAYCQCDLIVRVYARAWDEVSNEVMAKVEAYERLRGKVEMLPHSRWVGTAWILRDDVLALIDGDSDG